MKKKRIFVSKTERESYPGNPYCYRTEKEAAASDYQKLQELAEQEAEYTAEYDALMEKWEVLSEAIAAEEG